MTWNSFGSLKREKTDTIQLTIKIAEKTHVKVHIIVKATCLVQLVQLQSMHYTIHAHTLSLCVEGNKCEYTPLTYNINTL